MKHRTHPFSILLATLLLILLWAAAAALLARPILPGPLTTAQKMLEILPGKLSPHLMYSLGRVLLGMGISALLGAALGYLMGSSSRWDRLLSPVLYFTYPIPKVALLPVVMLLCGLGLLSKTLMIVLITVFQIILTVRDAVQALPAEPFDLMKTLGAGRLQLFSEVVFPASLPALLTALRLALGTAISVLFFTETYGTSYGLGYFIMDAWLRMNYPEMYAGILLLSLTGFLLFCLLDVLERICCRWAR